MPSGFHEATSRIRRLRGVSWEWRDDAPDDAREQPGRGVIAQDVEAVFPELVETDEQGMKSVDYDGLVAPLCVALGELLQRSWGVVRCAEEQAEGAGMDEPNTESADRVADAARGARGTSLDPEAVRRVFPELVTTDEHGETVIAYHGLIGPLIEAVKELDRRLATLEARVPRERRENDETDRS
jgi:hypothetical protein